jgi:CRP-like cAMP-binding protein
MYVFAGHFCFTSSLLMGRIFREVFSLAQIQRLWVDEKDSNKLHLMVADSTGGTDTWYLLGSRAFSPMTQVFKKYQRVSGPGQEPPDMYAKNDTSRFRDSRLELTDAQWDIIFENCGHTKRYQAGEVIVKEGTLVAKIFQIVRGKCRVEMEVEEIQGTTSKKSTQVVGRMSVGEFFGENSFLFGGTATASVMSHSQETELHILDKASLQRLFFHKPELAGGFYKALALSIEGRLWQRNNGVLQKYSALLAKKVQDGDLSRDSLFGGAAAKGTPPPMVRVGRPIRMESLGQLSVLAVSQQGGGKK